MNDKLAAIINKYRSHPEFLGITIDDPNQPGAVDDTLLHLSARKGAIEDIDILVSSGAVVDASGDLGNTPLHQAAMTGQVESVRALIRLGASKEKRNEFGQTPLDVAELGGKREVAQILKSESLNGGKAESNV
jgi:ankyrin repeat protein